MKRLSNPSNPSNPWARGVTALLTLYWIALMAGTHTPNLSIGTPQYNDKTAHYVAFAGLAFLLSWTWTTRRPFVPRGILFALCVAALYGALDEYTQLFVPGRFGDVADWVADALGAVSGVCTFWLLDLLWQRFVKRYWY